MQKYVYFPFLVVILHTISYIYYNFIQDETKLWKKDSRSSLFVC